MEKLIITNIDYSAGTLIVSVEYHPIGNDFNFKEIHDLIEEYGAVNQLVFKDFVSDLNQVYEVALLLYTYKPNLEMTLISNKDDLNSLNMSNTLSPIPFTRLIMNDKIYKVIKDKTIRERI